MSNLVTIKAEQLKYLPLGFRFYHVNCWLVSCGFGNGEHHAWYEGEPVEPFGMDEEVQVDPDAYRDAMVDFLKGVFVDLRAIVKYGWIVWVNAFDTDGVITHVPVKIDPQPWLEEFTLEVE